MKGSSIEAFVSCSYHEKDREIVDYICEFAKALNFAIYIADNPDIRPPQEKIKQEIEARDCIIVIATRQERVQDQNVWTTSQWILAEIGMAFALGKPVIAFIEKDVEAKKLTERISSYSEFQRDTLMSKPAAIVEFLSKAKDELYEVISKSSRAVTPFTYEEVKSYTSLEDNGQWMMEREMKLLCLTQQLSEVFESTWISNSSDLPFVNPQLTVYLLKPKGGQTIDHKITYSTTQHIHWKEKFDPPIEAQDTVELGWQLRSGGFIAKTLEEIEKLQKKGTYFLMGAFCEDGVTMRYPTKHLTFEIRFPHGYVIDEPQVAVAIGEDPAAIFSKSEEIRITRNNWFQSKLGRTCSLELNIENPLFGHTYLIRWKPPKADAYPKFG